MVQGTSEQVERIFVASTTSGTYSDKIILLIMWLFDTSREFLNQEYIHEFEAMNHEDLLGLQLREKDENMTNRRKRNPINDITGIQNLKRQLVGVIHTSQNRIIHNSPVEIDGEGDITYEVVRDYMASKMNVAYVEKASV